MSGVDHAPSRRAVLSLPALLWLTRPLLAAEQSPADFVAEIYGLAGGPSRDGSDGASIFADSDNEKRFLSQRLQRAIRTMLRHTPKGDAPNLDFDPVSNGNDPNFHDLHIMTESETGSRAVVVADFVSHQDTVRSVLRYQLVRERGGWRIDDIIASGKNNWQVSKIIRGVTK